MCGEQGYVADQKQHPPRTLQYDYAESPFVVPRGGVVSYERGNPVGWTLRSAVCLNLQLDSSIVQ
jgi:hypothetical protein